MQCVGGNVDFLKNCYERLFHVVDTYRAELVGPHRDWQERKTMMDQLVRECRYEHIRIQAPAAIETAAEAVDRVIEIVCAMKAMCHPGTEEKVGTDLNVLIRNATTISRNRWKTIAQIDFQLDEALPEIAILPAAFSQVILNLIVNAADAIADKYGENGKETGRIILRTRSDAERFFVEVEDDGCGIPEAIKSRIFDPFFTTKQVGKGTGQGLAICYDVVANKHGGSIDVVSDGESGARFIVTLPIHSDLPDSAKPIDKFGLQRVPPC
jgi:signal transduction histidine kinase